MISGLTANQQAFFNNGLTRFKEKDSVSGTAAGESGSGVGPRFNMNSCAGCDAQPAIGGTNRSGTRKSALPASMVFFLHDGRTHDLLQAIEQHDSPGSEADLVVDAFNSLTASQQQDVLNFLRSL